MSIPDHFPRDVIDLVRNRLGVLDDALAATGCVFRALGDAVGVQGMRYESVQKGGFVRFLTSLVERIVDVIRLGR
jgi:hypothetical protein